MYSPRIRPPTRQRRRREAWHTHACTHVHVSVCVRACASEEDAVRLPLAANAKVVDSGQPQNRCKAQKKQPEK